MHLLRRGCSNSQNTGKLENGVTVAAGGYSSIGLEISSIGLEITKVLSLQGAKVATFNRDAGTVRETDTALIGESLSIQGAVRST